MTPTTVLRVLALTAVLTLLSIAPASAVSSSSYEKQVVKATNAYRASLGKVAVKQQKCVDRWAESQARWMAKHGVLEHRDGRLRTIMKDCRLTGASENIAWNFSSGNKTVAAWKKSSGHARNMRAGTMRYIGVGAVEDSNGEWWVAQVFGTRK
ncbi:MAG: CAP domain-containing protein [Aeromicrobium sp.]